MSIVYNLKWSDSEKKIARCMFQAALSAELQETIADFKRRAAAVSAPEEMWELEEYLRRRRTEIDRKYDYRYSQLIFSSLALCCVRGGSGRPISRACRRTNWRGFDVSLLCDRAKLAPRRARTWQSTRTCPPWAFARRWSAGHFVRRRQARRRPPPEEGGDA